MLHLCNSRLSDNVRLTPLCTCVYPFALCTVIHTADRLVSCVMLNVCRVTWHVSCIMQYSRAIRLSSTIRLFGSVTFVWYCLVVRYHAPSFIIAHSPTDPATEVELLPPLQTNTPPMLWTQGGIKIYTTSSTQNIV